MAHTIIYDPEANIAALVDPEAPASLGPIAIGEGDDDPRRVLHEFVDGLDTPPDEMATWLLFNEWQSYVQAIVEMVQAEAEREAAGPTTDGASDDAPAEDGGSRSSESPSETPPASDAAPAGDGADVPVTEDEDLELSARIASAPHTPAKEGFEECWMCHAELTIEGPQGRVECPVCHGDVKGVPVADAS